jgi:hypothetical protein
MKARYNFHSRNSGSLRIESDADDESSQKSFSSESGQEEGEESDEEISCVDSENGLKGQRKRRSAPQTNLGKRRLAVIGQARSTQTNVLPKSRTARRAIPAGGPGLVLHQSSSLSFRFGGGFVCDTASHQAEGARCGVLEVLGLSYCSELCTFICPCTGGGVLVPGNVLNKHIKQGWHTSRISERFGRQLNSVDAWEEISTHLLSSYSVSPSQSTSSFSWQRISVSAPLLLPSNVSNQTIIGYFYECPWPGCSVLSIAAKGADDKYNVKYHYRDVHGAPWDENTGNAPACGGPELMQRISIAHSRTFVFLQLQSSRIKNRVNTTGPAPEYSSHQSEIIDGGAVQQRWMNTLAWPKYLKSLGSETSITSLKALVVMPSELCCDLAEGHMEHTEKGLLLIYRALPAYLQESLDTIKKCHPLVCAELTKG